MVELSVERGVQLHLLVEQVQAQEHGRDVGEQNTDRVNLQHIFLFIDQCLFA